MIRLWAINRVLRYVGLGIAVSVSLDPDVPTLIGIRWVGRSTWAIPWRGRHA